MGGVPSLSGGFSSVRAYINTIESANKRVKQLYDNFDSLLDGLPFSLDVRELHGIAKELSKTVEERELALLSIKNVIMDLAEQNPESFNDAALQNFEISWESIGYPIGYASTMASVRECIAAGVSTIDAADSYACIEQAFMGDGPSLGALGLVPGLEIFVAAGLGLMA